MSAGIELIGAYTNLFLVLLFAGLIILLFVIFIPSRSRRYRRELTDLYVAARIKQFAEKDNINLSEEYEAFKKWCKKKLMEDKSLDNTIEAELQDSITESTKSQQEVK